MPPFDTIGDRARWRILYDLLVTLDVGDVITYEAMGVALDLDPEADRHPIQMALRRAAKEYEQENNRVLDVIPNTGYRVVEATEHLVIARRQQKKSNKALQRGQSKVVHVDFNGMDPEIRKAFEITAQGFSMMLDMQRRMFRKQATLEAAVDQINARSDRTEEEIAALRERLARLEEERDTGDSSQ